MSNKLYTKQTKEIMDIIDKRKNIELLEVGCELGTES